MKYVHRIHSSMFVAFAFMLALSACAGQVAKPETPIQQWGYANATLRGLYVSADNLLNLKRITPEQSRMIADQLDSAKLTMSLARDTIDKGVPQNSIELLSAVNLVLIQVSNSLAEKEIAK